MSERRSVPYKNKPTDHDQQLMDALAHSRLLLLSEVGPTKFIIKQTMNTDVSASSGTEASAGGGASNKYQVVIGSHQTCTCPAFTKAKVPQLCIHIVCVVSHRSVSCVI